MKKKKNMVIVVPAGSLKLFYLGLFFCQCFIVDASPTEFIIILFLLFAHFTDYSQTTHICIS